VATAEETDFLPDNVSWNGFSELEDLARGMQLQLLLVEELDWDRLPAGATLFVVYPRAEVAPGQALAFLAGGGRILLADDFGESRPLLQRLHIERVETGAVQTGRHHAGNPNLPIAVPLAGGHPITAGVREVVANHPARFLSSFPTLLGFEGGVEQLAVGGQVGRGGFVALSDPSVLINGMLRFQGNLTFATNLLHHLRPRESNTVLLATGHFRIGSFRAPSSTENGPAGAVQQFLTEYNGFLGHLSDFALTQPALRALCWVCGGLGLLGLFMFLPLPRRSLDGHFLRPTAPGGPAVEAQVAWFSENRRPRGSTLPAILLRDEIEEVLTEILKAPGPVTTMEPSWVIAEVRKIAGAEGAEICGRLLGMLKRVPQQESRTDRSRLLRGTSSKDLTLLYELCRMLLSRLGSRSFPDLPRAPTGKDHAPDR
jgi:hypothetical protein